MISRQKTHKLHYTFCGYATNYVYDSKYAHWESRMWKKALSPFVLLVEIPILLLCETTQMDFSIKCFLLSTKNYLGGVEYLAEIIILLTVEASFPDFWSDSFWPK